MVIYQTTIKKLAQTWLSEWNSHGLLLAIISVYLFYQIWKKHKSQLLIKINISAYLALLVLSILWLFANLIFVEYVELVILPLIFAVMMAGLLGWRESKIYWFPFLLMLLGGPLLSLLVPVLQDITALLSGLLLAGLGFTIFVDGVLILVPAGTFEVDTGCSGLNVVTVGAILSFLYAYIHRFNLKGTIFLLGAGLLASIISNILRVSIIVVVGNATKMQHPLVNEHENLGWVVFLFVMGIFLYLVHHKMSLSSFLIDEDKLRAHENTVDVKRDYKGLYGPLLALLFASVGPMLLFYTQKNYEDISVGKIQSQQPIGTWRPVADTHPSWKPVYNAGEGDYRIRQTYKNVDYSPVYLDVTYFKRQGVGNEAVNVTNAVYDRHDWTRVWIKAYLPDTISGISDVEETLIRGKNNQEMLVWRWFATNGQKTGNAYKAKIFNLFGVLVGEPSIATYVVAIDVRDTYDNARKDLNNFVKTATNYIHP